MKPIKSVINNTGEDIINLDLTKNVATNKVNGLPFTLLGGATYTANSYLEVMGASGTMGAVAYEDVSSPLYPQEGFDLELTFAVNYLSPYTGGSEGSYALVASFIHPSTITSTLSILIDLNTNFLQVVFLGTTISPSTVPLYTQTSLRVIYTKADNKLTVVYGGATYTATVDTANTLFKRRFRNRLQLGRYTQSSGSFTSNGNFRFYSVKLRGITNKVEPIVYCDFINYPFVNDVGRGSVTTLPQCTQDTSVYPCRAKITSIGQNLLFKPLSFTQGIDITRDFQIEFKFLIENFGGGSSTHWPLYLLNVANQGVSVTISNEYTISLEIYGQQGGSYAFGTHIVYTDMNIKVIKRSGFIYLYLNDVLRISVEFLLSSTLPHYLHFGSNNIQGNLTSISYISDVRAFYLEPPKRRLLSIKPVTGSPITDGTGRHTLSYPAGVTVVNNQIDFAGGTSDFITVSQLLDDFRLQGDFTIGFKMILDTAPDYIESGNPAAWVGLLGLGGLSLVVGGVSGGGAPSGVVFRLQQGTTAIAGTYAFNPWISFQSPIEVRLSRIGNAYSFSATQDGNIANFFFGSPAATLSNTPNTQRTLKIGKCDAGTSTLNGKIWNFYFASESYTNLQ